MNHVSVLPLLFLTCTPFAAGQVPNEPSTKIKWQGYEWDVRQQGESGPGPNLWKSSNVWVDPSGFLHLKIANENGHWSCAEIWTTSDMGFGTYQCQVEGSLDKLDPNIVFSMFSYAGPDGTKEIDIEFAKWGNPQEKNAWWTVYPNDKQGTHKSEGFNLRLFGTYTTSRYDWTKDGVHYWMFGGHQPIDSLTNMIHEWDYRPPNPAHMITQHPIPLHFNLWLFEGKAPTDGKPVEIIVHSFKKI